MRKFCTENDLFVPDYAELDFLLAIYKKEKKAIKNSQVLSIRKIYPDCFKHVDADFLYTATYDHEHWKNWLPDQESYGLGWFTADLLNSFYNGRLGDAFNAV